MPSEQKPAHVDHLPWVPAASRAGSQGHPLHMAGWEQRHRASPQTIQQLHTNQWDSKMHPRGKEFSIMSPNKQSRENQRVRDTLQPPRRTFCTKTSPHPLEPAQGQAALQSPCQGNLTQEGWSAPVFPILCIYPALTRKGAE